MCAKKRDSVFDYDSRPVITRPCDSPGCADIGEHRAPKSRDRLNDYYWFCLNHVREYNAAWDYFAGLNSDEVEKYNRHASVWERPSWPIGSWQKREQELRDKIMQDFFAEAGMDIPSPQAPIPVIEREALKTLGLTQAVTFAEIKAHYRNLVKQHHPDVHGGSLEAEEKFKALNHAFTILKQSYKDDGA